MTTQTVLTNTHQTHLLRRSDESDKCAKPTAIILLLMVEQGQPTTIRQEMVLQIMDVARVKTASATCDGGSRNRTETSTEPLDMPPILNQQRWIEALTDREVEVLHLINAGLSNRAIAEQLVIALSTVKRHLSNIYGKLGVHSRIAAVVRAKQFKLLLIRWTLTTIKIRFRLKYAQP